MYSFYLGGMKFPITPSELEVKIKGANKTLTLANEGEINFLRTPGLTEVEVDMVVPAFRGYSFSDSYRSPDYYLSQLESMMTSKEPIQFVVSRTSPSGSLLFDTNLKVGIEDYTIKEDAEDNSDLTISISLKQYRSYGTKTVELPKKEKEEEKKTVVKTEPKRETTSKPKTKTYTVKSGDCLWTIAKKYYGNGAQWNKIYNANKGKINNPNLIYPGQVFTIP